MTATIYRVGGREVEPEVWAFVQAMNDEIQRLRRWESEASTVIAEWEQVWEAAGRPGPLGTSKARSTLAWVLEAVGRETP